MLLMCVGISMHAHPISLLTTHRKCTALECKSSVSSGLTRIHFSVYRCMHPAVLHCTCYSALYSYSALYMLFCIVHAILHCTCYSALYMLFCIVHAILHRTCYSASYMLFCIVHAILHCTCYSALYMLFCIVHAILHCTCDSALHMLFCFVHAILHCTCYSALFNFLSTIKLIAATLALISNRWYGLQDVKLIQAPSARLLDTHFSVQSAPHFPRLWQHFHWEPWESMPVMLSSTPRCLCHTGWALSIALSRNFQGLGTVREHSFYCI